MIHDVWNYLSESEREGKIVRFAETAAEFHNNAALSWLMNFVTVVTREHGLLECLALGFSPREELDQPGWVAEWILRRRLAGPLVALLGTGFELVRGSSEEVAKEVGQWHAVVRAAAPAHITAWTAAFLAADAEGRDGLAGAVPESRDFLRFAWLVAGVPHGNERGMKRVREELVNHVIAHCGGNRAWMLLLKAAGVVAWNSPKESRAVLAAGLTERQIGSELMMAAWLFPERLPALLSADVDNKWSCALHWAAAANSVEAVTLLLAAGFHVDEYGSVEEVR
jgi:hypothetical protein